MGAEVVPVFNPRVPGVSFSGDGKLLLDEHQVLDEIASDLGVTLFTAFCDNREVPDDFDGDPDELDDLLGEWDEWFSIDDGLKTIEGIRNAIKTDAKTASRLEEPECICSDLDDLARCLRAAGDAGSQFRFEIL